MGVVVASAWILVMVKLGEAPTHTLQTEKMQNSNRSETTNFHVQENGLESQKSSSLLESLKSCEALPRILEQASALRRRRH